MIGLFVLHGSCGGGKADDGLKARWVCDAGLILELDDVGVEGAKLADEKTPLAAKTAQANHRGLPD
jgi:hypothetical protein